MSGNTGGKFSSVMVTVFGTVAMSLHGRTKFACKHVSTQTLKSVIELRKSV